MTTYEPAQVDKEVFHSWTGLYPDQFDTEWKKCHAALQNMRTD